MQNNWDLKAVETFFGNPYTDKGEIREFDVSRDDEEYVWHRDKEDREIEIIEGEGWRFQFQNCLPWLLEEGMIFDIPEGEYHRLIRGATNLKVRIIRNG